MMEKTKPMASPVKDEMHGVDLAANGHGGAARKLVFEFLQDAVEVADTPPRSRSCALA